MEFERGWGFESLVPMVWLPVELVVPVTSILLVTKWKLAIVGFCHFNVKMSVLYLLVLILRLSSDLIRFQVTERQINSLNLPLAELVFG